MSSKKTWKPVEEAITQYRMDTSLLLKWAEHGVIRAKQIGTRSMLVNTEDLTIKLSEITGVRVVL